MQIQNASVSKLPGGITVQHTAGTCPAVQQLLCLFSGTLSGSATSRKQHQTLLLDAKKNITLHTFLQGGRLSIWQTSIVHSEPLEDIHAEHLRFKYVLYLRSNMATQHRFTAPPMEVRLHGSIPEGSEDILTPETLR